MGDDEKSGDNDNNDGDDDDGETPRRCCVDTCLSHSWSIQRFKRIADGKGVSYEATPLFIVIGTRLRSLGWLSSPFALIGVARMAGL